jgi:hypothetical protein
MSVNYSTRGISKAILCSRSNELGHISEEFLNSLDEKIKINLNSSQYRPSARYIYQRSFKSRQMYSFYFPVHVIEAINGNKYIFSSFTGNLTTFPVSKL